MSRRRQLVVQRREPAQEFRHGADDEEVHRHVALGSSLLQPFSQRQRHSHGGGDPLLFVEPRTRHARTLTSGCDTVADTARSNPRYQRAASGAATGRFSLANIGFWDL
jgi:hypothetical protein